MSGDKNNSDVYTPTEWQHDFGTYGLRKRLIMQDESAEFRRYVDNHHGYTQTNDQSGLDDDGLVKCILKVTRKSGRESGNVVSYGKTYDGRGGKPLKEMLGDTNVSDKFNHTNWTNRNVADQPIITSRAGANTIKIIFEPTCVVDITAREYCVTICDKNEWVGKKLAMGLGIPNKSVIIIDTDSGGLMKKFKKKSKHYSQTTHNKYVLFLYFNPLINADSAWKANPFENQKAFSVDHEGIGIKAIIDRRSQKIHGNNNELKMNYIIKSSIAQDDGRKVKQVWEPQDDNVFQGLGNGGKTYIADATVENNISATKDMAKSLWEKGFLHPPPPTPPPTLLEYDNKILALMRKRSGDLFQGYAAKIFKKMPDRSVEVMYYTKRPVGWNPFSERHSLRDIVNKPSQDCIVSTGDYPFLAWCIENRLNVLFFPPPGGSKDDDRNLVFHFHYDKGWNRYDRLERVLK